MFICNQCGECCRHLGQSEVYAKLDRGDGVCRYLKRNICSIYKNRPLLCRVDECYEMFFKSQYNYEEYKKLNYEACNLLKRKKEEYEMPLPFIIGGLAAAAGVVGIGTGIRGGMKMKDANDTMKSAQEKQENAVARFEDYNEKATLAMDKLGEQELNILASFERFSDLIERIQGRPEFKKYSKNGIDLPEYKEEELKKVSAGAGVLLGGISGAVAGTAGGFAAAGATTSAVMALGVASTGTAISSLSGAAATSATLAALGGGALSAGGGGMALGSAVLSGATLGVGFLVGGIIFNITGSKLADKADEAYSQACKTEEQTDKINWYLRQLREAAGKYRRTLIKVEGQYQKRLEMLDHMITFSGRTDWTDFSESEKKMTENLVLLVGLLYKMCQVKLVLQAEGKNELNSINKEEIDVVIHNAKNILEKEMNDDAA